MGFNRQEKVIDGLLNASQGGENAQRNGDEYRSVQNSQGHSSKTRTTSSLFDNNTVVYSRSLINKGSTVVNATEIRHLTQENPSTNTLFKKTPQASNSSGNFGHITPATNSKMSTVQGVDG